MRPLPAFLLLLLLHGCNATTASQPDDKCHRQGGGRAWFIGTPECMRKLPQRRMSGVWVLGMEYSVFYEGATHVPSEAFSPDPNSVTTDVWLDAVPENLLERHGFRFDGYNQAYRVEFIGTKSDSHGVYGHGGMYQHGALAEQLLKVEEIKLR